MRRSAATAAVALVLILAAAAPAPAAAQSMASMISSAWDEPALEGSQFSLAFDRWAGSFGESRIGMHLAAHPADSVVMSAALAELGNGDFGFADDASLIGFFDVVGASLQAAPVEACALFLEDTQGEEFVDILASADSALAERWIVAIEGLLMSTVAPGPTGPAADETRVQALVVRAMAALPAEQVERWLRQMDAPPESLTPAERCDNVRTIFQVMAAVPAEERAGMLRHSFVKAGEAEAEAAVTPQ